MAQDNNPKKLTKRKGFNFFRSYYDVYNELETDKDKIAFIEALLDRQFLGIKPQNLSGMAKFAYISQTNSIDSQVKGYEDKTGQSLRHPTQPPTSPPTQGGVIRGNLPPTLQEEVEGEVKGQGEVKVNIIPKVETLDFVKLLEYLNSKTGRGHKVLNKTLKSKYLARLKDGFTAKQIRIAIDNATCTQYHKENGYQYLTPEFFSRADTLNKYGVESKSQTLNTSRTSKIIT